MKEQSSSSFLDDPASAPEVQSAYSQLHQVIDNLDGHVKQLVKRHQAEFILAYRNHIIKVKDELSLLKKKAQQQERLTSGVTRIDKLQRQVTLFREQALKIYHKLQEKTKQYQEYKTKYNEVYQLNTRNQELIKQLTKRLKGIQVKNRQIQFEREERQLEIFQSQSIDIQNTKKKQTKGKQQQFVSSNPSLRATGILSQTNFSLQQLLKSQFPTSTQQEQQSALIRISSFMKSREAQITSRLQNFKKQQLLIQSKQQSSTFQLKQWFLQCVKTVKSEIKKRNPNIIKVQKQVMSVSNINQFLRIDKLRLLELFISNQKLLTTIYNKLFPDKVAQIQGYLSKKHKQETQEEQKQIQKQYQQHFQDIQKPKVILAKNKKKIQSVGNRVIIKNGKLNLIN